MLSVTQSNKCNMKMKYCWLIKWLLYHVCVELDANLEWLIQLEYDEVQPESKDQHLAAFWQNKPTNQKALHV